MGTHQWTCMSLEPLLAWPDPPIRVESRPPEFLESLEERWCCSRRNLVLLSDPIKVFKGKQAHTSGGVRWEASASCMHEPHTAFVYFFHIGPPRGILYLSLCIMSEWHTTHQSDPDRDMKLKLYPKLKLSQKGFFRFCTPNVGMWKNRDPDIFWIRKYPELNFSKWIMNALQAHVKKKAAGILETVVRTWSR